jgi:hypothetical protein
MAVQSQKTNTPILVSASDLKATVRGIEYRWLGGFGAVVTSCERRIREADVRMIGNVVFFANSVRRTWRWSRWRIVCWVPQQEIDADWLRRFKAELFR